jgi:hypothetical protein
MAASRVVARAPCCSAKRGVRGGPAPYPDFLEAADLRERREMRPRLHAAPEQRQHSAFRSRQIIRDRRRHGSRPHLGDQAPVHDRHRFAGVRAEQQDHRKVGRYVRSGIARVEADELRPHGFVCYRRHDAEVALTLLDRQHVARGLYDLAARKRGERLLHCRDQFTPTQQAANLLLVQIEHNCRPLGRRLRLR